MARVLLLTALFLPIARSLGVSPGAPRRCVTRVDVPGQRCLPAVNIFPSSLCCSVSGDGCWGAACCCMTTFSSFLLYTTRVHMACR